MRLMNQPARILHGFTNATGDQYAPYYYCHRQSTGLYTIYFNKDIRIRRVVGVINSTGGINGDTQVLFDSIDDTKNAVDFRTYFASALNDLSVHFMAVSA